MLVLVTRPEPDGERTAAALRTRGHAVLLAPMLAMRPCEAEFASRSFAGVLVTSGNALRALATHPQCAEMVGLPLLAVGMRTAAMARAIGFATVHTAGGDAEALAEMAAAVFRGAWQPLLYLAAADRAADLAPELARHGLTVETVVVYRMEPAAGFPHVVASNLAAGEVGAVLHYSQRSAETYLACADAGSLRSAALRPLHCCFSPAVAGPLRAAGAAFIRVAREPEEAALLGLLESRA